ncbi:MAG: DUF4062 domain-containing protein [Bacteroidales bacterium]|nr:DUF4062 domain-containing protein [Bacteroidales bacterium]
MAKKKIFISSVQSEFSEERKALHDYLIADPLLGKFFEPFLFELLPALESGAIEMKYPDSPNHPNQKYKLTHKGFAIKRAL